MKDAIEKVIRLKAGPERVWKAITDPAELALWFPDRTDLEPEPGATGWFEWTEHGRFAVRVLEIDPPRRLVWTWARDAGASIDETPLTVVEWTLEAQPDGGTTVHLRESGFADPKWREGNDRGWDKELGHLVEYLESGMETDR